MKRAVLGSLLFLLSSLFCYAQTKVESKQDNVKKTKCDTSVESVSWSPDGKTYVTSNGNKLLIWDSETDEIIASKEDSAASILSVKFSPTGNNIVTVYNDNTFILQDLSPNSTFKIKQTGIFNIPILDAVFYKDAYTVLAPLDGQNLYKLNLNPKQIASINEILSSDLIVYSIDIDKNNENVAVTYSDGTVRIIEVASKRIIKEVKGNPNTNEIIAARFSDSGSYFLYSKDSRTLKVEAVTGTRVYTVKDYDMPVNRADFSPNGKAVVAADKFGFVKIYNIAEGYVEDAIELDEGDVAYNCQFALDGSSILIGTKLGYVIRWIPKTRKVAVAGYGKDNKVEIISDESGTSGTGEGSGEGNNGDDANGEGTTVYKTRPLFDGKGGIFNQVVELNPHNLYIGAGFGSIKSDNFLGNLKTKVGYKNFGFYPFFWGGTLGFDVGFMSPSFPKKYYANGKQLPPPILLTVAPTGIAGIHYLFEKPNILVFAELGMGANIRVMALQGFVGNPAASFFTEIALGAQWKFLRAEVDAVIDTSFNFSINGTIGAVIKLPSKKGIKGEMK